jgi:hypothetical protein
MEVVFKNVYLSFKEYALLNLRYSIKIKPLTIVPLLLLPLGAVGTWVFILTNLPFSALSQMLDFRLVFLTLLGIFMPVSTWLGLRRNYQSTKFLHAPTTYLFSDAGVQVDSLFLQATSSWETIRALHIMNAKAILLNSTLTGFFLDFRCLKAPATKADFLALLQRHSIPVK